MRKLAIFAFSFGAGAFISTYFLPENMLLYAAAVLAFLAGAAALLWRGEWGKRALLFLLGLLCAVSRVAVFCSVQLSDGRDLCGTEEQCTFEIADYSSETDYGVKVQAKLQGVNTMLYLFGEYDLAPGDTVTATARIELSTGDDEQENTSYRAKGILLTAYVSEEAQVKKAESLPFKYYPQYVAMRLKESIFASFPGETGQFMTALILGDKTGMDNNTYRYLRNSGLSHVVAVSGLHVSFLIAAAGKLFRGRKLKAAVGIPILLFFMLMAGCTPSVVRAVVMNILLLAAPLFNRESDNATTLGASLLLILLENPYAAQSVSLQLSYGAVIGIMAFSDRLGAFLRRKLGYFGRKGVNRVLAGAVADSFSVSAGAMALTIPVSAYYFGTITILAPISNLLVLWVVSLLFPLGVLTAALGIFLPTVSGVMGIVLSVPVRYILLVARVISSLGFGVLSSKSVPMLAWLVYAYLVLTVMYFTKGWSRRWHIPVCSVAVALCFASLANALYADSRDLTVAVLDVGQGQSIVVTAGKETVIIDSGGDAYGGETAVEEYLLSIGRTSAQAMVLTHFHDDHAGYVPEVLSAVVVDTIFLPELGEESELEKAVRLSAGENGTEIYAVTEECGFSIGGARVKLFPPVSAQGENEACMSCLVSFREYDLLVTGDMPSDTERVLLGSYDIPDTELLVVGHHGSKYSTGEIFLDNVRPETAIISVGADNRYGHPTQEVLRRLEDRGIEVYRTDENGTVVITFEEGK